MNRICFSVYAAVFIISCSAIEAFSQSASLIDGPPAPIAPEVITRDSAGRVTVRAIKLTAPLIVDGKLDEEVYQREQPIGGMVQVAPDYGKPVSERTDIWIT